MTDKRAFLDAVASHPDYHPEQIASLLGCSPAYVRKAASLYGQRLPRKNRAKQPAPVKVFSKIRAAGT